MSGERLIRVGRIVGVHGVSGWVKLESDTEDALSAGVDAFRAGFLKADGTPLLGQAEDEDQAAPVEQEQIVRQKKA